MFLLVDCSQWLNDQHIASARMRELSVKAVASMAQFGAAREGYFVAATRFDGSCAVVLYGELPARTAASEWLRTMLGLSTQFIEDRETLSMVSCLTSSAVDSLGRMWE